MRYSRVEWSKQKTLIIVVYRRCGELVHITCECACVKLASGGLPNNQTSEGIFARASIRLTEVYRAPSLDRGLPRAWDVSTGRFTSTCFAPSSFDGLPVICLICFAPSNLDGLPVTCLDLLRTLKPVVLGRFTADVLAR